MTYLEVVFNYGALPGETELRAIDTMREVYGIRRVQFSAKERTVRVEFDASRMKQDAAVRLWPALRESRPRASTLSPIRFHSANHASSSPT